MSTIAWLLVLSCGFSAITAGTTRPRKSLLHDLTQFKDVDFGNGSVIPCRKITEDNPCPPGTEIDERCDFHKGQMKCTTCSEGYYQCDFLTTSNAIKCYLPQCPEVGKETVVKVTNNTDGTCSLDCVCNEALGYSGTNYMDCTLQKTVCGIDSELKNGVCVGCPKGFHNPNKHFGTCVPELTKPPVATSTSVYVEVNDTTTTTPTPKAAVSKDERTIPSTTPITTTQSPSRGKDEKDDKIFQQKLPGLVVGVVVLIVVIFTITALGIAFRQGTINCNTACCQGQVTQHTQNNTGYAPVSSGNPGDGAVKTNMNGCSGAISMNHAHISEGEEGREARVDVQSETPPDRSENIPGHPPPPAQCPEQPAGADLNVALIFAKEDDHLTEEIKRKMGEMVLHDRRKVRVWDYNHPSFGGCKLNHPRKFTALCPLVLVVLTKNTSNDNECLYMIQEAVGITRLSDNGEKEDFRVRPLHTESRNTRSYEEPNGFAGVSHLEWFDERREDDMKEFLNQMIQETSER